MMDKKFDRGYEKGCWMGGYCAVEGSEGKLLGPSHPLPNRVAAVQLSIDVVVEQHPGPQRELKPEGKRACSPSLAEPRERGGTLPAGVNVPSPKSWKGVGARGPAGKMKGDELDDDAVEVRACYWRGWVGRWASIDDTTPKWRCEPVAPSPTGWEPRSRYCLTSYAVLWEHST